MPSIHHLKSKYDSICARIRYICCFCCRCWYFFYFIFISVMLLLPFRFVGFSLVYAYTTHRGVFNVLLLLFHFNLRVVCFFGKNSVSTTGKLKFGPNINVNAMCWKECVFVSVCMYVCVRMSMAQDVFFGSFFSICYPILAEVSFDSLDEWIYVCIYELWIALPFFPVMCA